MRISDWSSDVCSSDLRIEGFGRQRELVHVAVADLAVAQRRLLQRGPRDGQHVARQVNADGALDAPREQFEDASGTGPDVEQFADLAFRQQRQQRLLDLASVDLDRKSTSLNSST